MVSPWSQATSYSWLRWWRIDAHNAAARPSVSGLLPKSLLHLRSNRLSRMCCDVQVYHISLEAPLSEAATSLDWDIGLVIFAVAIE
ncbi:hypothetical protein GGI42DRAFT_185448 [Trichoderma sp. SZMC 28013]